MYVRMYVCMCVCMHIHTAYYRAKSSSVKEAWKRPTLDSDSTELKAKLPQTITTSYLRTHRHTHAHIHTNRLHECVRVSICVCVHTFCYALLLEGHLVSREIPTR